MDPLGNVRARGDGESVNSVAVKSPTAGSQMNNNFVSSQANILYSYCIYVFTKARKQFARFISVERKRLVLQ